MSRSLCNATICKAEKGHAHFKAAVSNLARKMLAYEGAILVLVAIAVPCDCK